MGGSGSEVDYQQSPEQRQVYQNVMPLVMAMARNAQSGTPAWQIPQMPDIPEMPSAYQGIERAMPTSAWWNSISPDIKQAAWQPYEDMTDNLMESLGYGGSVGSPSGGFSGAAGEALGREVVSRAATQIPAQLWNMTGPQMQQAWQQDYGTEKGRVLAGYESEAQRRQEQLRAISYPWQTLPGLLGGTYSDAIVDPGEASPIAGILGGASSGATMGTAAGGIVSGATAGTSVSPGWGTLIGGVGGGLIGAFS